jgi:hypothetical protein
LFAGLSLKQSGNFSIAILVETGETFEDLALRRARERAAVRRGRAQREQRGRGRSDRVVGSSVIVSISVEI